jgi:transcription antitermination factor NusG
MSTASRRVKRSRIDRTFLPRENEILVVSQFEFRRAWAARSLQETGGRMRTYRLREGQIVRVVDGPFTGFCGEVKEGDEKSSTVKVAVQVYGRVTSMDVNA